VTSADSRVVAIRDHMVNLLGLHAPHGWRVGPGILFTETSTLRAFLRTPQAPISQHCRLPSSLMIWARHQDGTVALVLNVEWSLQETDVSLFTRGAWEGDVFSLRRLGRQ
jgi:hypothetical protein